MILRPRFVRSKTLHTDRKSFEIAAHCRGRTRRLGASDDGAKGALASQRKRRSPDFEVLCSRFLVDFLVKSREFPVYFAVLKDYHAVVQTCQPQARRPCTCSSRTGASSPRTALRLLRTQSHLMCIRALAERFSESTIQRCTSCVVGLSHSQRMPSSGQPEAESHDTHCGAIREPPQADHASRHGNEHNQT